MMNHFALKAILNKLKLCKVVVGSKKSLIFNLNKRLFVTVKFSISHLISEY